MRIRLLLSSAYWLQNNDSAISVKYICSIYYYYYHCFNSTDLCHDSNLGNLTVLLLLLGCKMAEIFFYLLFMYHRTYGCTRFTEDS